MRRRSLALEIERLRRQRTHGVPIVRRLGLVPRSTVGGGVLRLGLGRRKALGPPTPGGALQKERLGELILLGRELGRIEAHCGG